MRRQATFLRLPAPWFLTLLLSAPPALADSAENQPVSPARFNTGIMKAMTSQEQNKDKAEILAALREYHAAMVSGRVDLLDQMLDKDFTLVHITGYVQPKRDWFSVINSRQFDYHRIDIDEKTHTLNLSGQSAALNGHGIYEATINGLKRPWRLQFEIHFERQDEKWKIMDARYTSF
jgi:hypothetical protein